MSQFMESKDERPVPPTEESDWTPVRLTFGLLSKIAIVAFLLYMVISHSGMGGTFGLLVLILGVWILRDMVRLVIQKPQAEYAAPEAAIRQVASDEVAVDETAIDWGASEGDASDGADGDG